MRDISREKDVVIFGVGDIGTDLHSRFLRLSTNPVKCFCDNNPDKQGTKCNEIDVLSPGAAVKKYSDGTFIVTVINHTEAVRKQLIQLGIPEKSIICFSAKDFINEEDRKSQEAKKAAYEEWCLKHNNKIQGLKNKFKGERCFIIGNGGSLTTEDLEKLQGEYTFGCNRLYKLYEKLSFRPVFYCFYDVQRVKKLKKDLPYILDNCEYLFTSSTIKDELEETVIEDEKTYFVHVEKEKYYPQLPKFSSEVEKQVYDGQTVLYMAAQIAVYLGFEEIYYLGADNHYSVELNLDGTIKQDINVKDYPDGMGGIELETSVIPQMELTTMSFVAVKEYAAKHNIRVFNATRGGCLEVFERVDFDTLF